VLENNVMDAITIPTIEAYLYRVGSAVGARHDDGVLSGFGPGERDAPEGVFAARQTGDGTRSAFVPR